MYDLIGGFGSGPLTDGLVPVQISSLDSSQQRPLKHSKLKATIYHLSFDRAQVAR